MPVILAIWAQPANKTIDKPAKTLSRLCLLGIDPKRGEETNV
jgi:hypothetical protein